MTPQEKHQLSFVSIAWIFIYGYFVDTAVKLYSLIFNSLSVLSYGSPVSVLGFSGLLGEKIEKILSIQDRKSVK